MRRPTGAFSKPGCILGAIWGIVIYLQGPEPVLSLETLGKGAGNSLEFGLSGKDSHILLLILHNLTYTLLNWS